MGILFSHNLYNRSPEKVREFLRKPVVNLRERDGALLIPVAVVPGRIQADLQDIAAFSLDKLLMALSTSTSSSLPPPVFCHKTNI
jgi:hypothetical protein